MTWGFLARIWSKKLTKNKYVTSPTPQIPSFLNPHIPPNSPPYSPQSSPLPLPHFFPTPPPCFPLYPIPSKDPLSHPFPPQISLPTPILHTQIIPSLLSIPFTQSSSPYFPLNPSLASPQTTPNM